MPKITEKDFGKKMRQLNWDPEVWFMPLAFHPQAFSNSIIGVNNAWEIDDFFQEHSWSPVEEPKKKVIKRMAPALNYDRCHKYYAQSQVLYESEEKARTDNPIDFFKWPANDTSWVEVEVEE